MGRPLIVLAAVAIALPIAGAIAPASGLTSRGVSTPLGSEMHASRHLRHVHVTSPDVALTTPSRPPVTTPRRVTIRPPVAPPQTRPVTRHPTEPQHPKKKPKKPKKPVKKHHKPTPVGNGPSPAPKKKPSHR